MNQRIINNLLSLSLFLLVSIQLWGQHIPEGYYDNAVGKKKAELKTALHGIIKSAKVLGYGSGAGKTWSGFAKTDVDKNGNYVDMYSSNKVPVNGTSAGSGMNIEHSFAKSWWGGQKVQAYCDIQQLRPSNSGANSSKGSWPMAVVDGKKTYDNGVIKVGKSSSRPGGEISAWEPSDEYKGDFARIYMYMVTCYEDYASRWMGNSANQLDNNTYPVFEPWTVELLLKWCRQDPVSEWEIQRNDKVYDIQGNRNPFVDYPELAEYVWGEKTDTEWSPGGTTDPVINSPKDQSIVDMGVTAINIPLVKSIRVSGRNLTENITLAVSGTGFELSTKSVTKEEAPSGKDITVTFKSSANGSSSAILTLKSGSLTTTVTLKAEAVDGIPALPAENVMTSSFIACWTDLLGGMYSLKVFESDGTTLLKGYPVTVQASTGEYAVTELTPATVYYYQLSQGSVTSNKVKVTTLAPTPLLTTSLPDGDLNFAAAPGESPAQKRVIVHAEFLKNNIEATIDTPFEISLDRENWSQSQTVDKEGETIYVRMPATDEVKRWEGELSFATESLPEPVELDVTAVVEISKNYLEDFEQGVKSGYGFGNVKCTMNEWTFDDAGLFGQTNFDRYNGKQAVRLGKTDNSYVCMNEDKVKGIGRLSFSAGLCGVDQAGEIQVSYSTDGGVSWKNSGNPVEIKEPTLQKFSFEINVEGAARIKIQKTKGGRLNIDDVEMSDYMLSSISSEPKAGLAVLTGKGHLVIQADSEQEVSVFNTEGRTVYRKQVSQGETVLSLPQGNYIVSTNESNQKVSVY